MKAFEKIIGYNNIKAELNHILDIIHNKEKYSKLGVKLPRGVLLHGDVGLGKSLFANCFIEASGWKSYVCRKDEPDGDFVKHITKTFEEAKENAPCIILLDDMDKFANEDERHRNAEEYIVIQSGIDSVKDKEILVFATANELRNLPESLLRIGRFDRKIKINNPIGKDAVNIIKYYLSQKKFVDEIDAEEIANIMSSCSCAELETLINEAGIYAGYKNKEKIEMEDIIKACLRQYFGAPAYAENDLSVHHYEDIGELKNCNKNIQLETAYHEAGHAVVAEILEPKSVSLISIEAHKGDIGGITVYNQNENYFRCKKYMDNRIISLLSGRAATEIFSAEIDVGASDDINRAYRIIERFVTEYCAFGFECYEFHGDSSQGYRSKKEDAIFKEMDRYYQIAKKILLENKTFLDKLAHKLVEKKNILSKDIQQIKEECKNK